MRCISNKLKGSRNFYPMIKSHVVRFLTADEVSIFSISGTLIFCSLLIFFREIKFFVEPRIWAEEGSIYIQSFIDNGFESFFFPHLGYYSFLNKLIINFGLQIGGIKNIAFVTTYSSFIWMLIVILMPFWIKSRYWELNYQKLALITFSLIISPGEIWLNTINLQFFCTLACIYLILSEPEKLSLSNYFLASFIFVISMLTGITSVILIPFFFRRMRNGSESERFKIWFYLAFLALLIQLAAFFFCINYQHENRFSISNVVNLPLSFLGFFRFPGTLDFLPRAISSIFSVFFFLGVMSVIRKSKKNLLLVYLAIWIAFVFSVSSLSMNGGGRYVYVVGMVTIMLLLNSLGDHTTKKLSACLLCFICFKSVDYFYGSAIYPYDWKTYSSEVLRLDGRPGFIEVFPQNGSDKKWGIWLK